MLAAGTPNHAIHYWPLCIHKSLKLNMDLCGTCSAAVMPRHSHRNLSDISPISVALVPRNLHALLFALTVCLHLRHTSKFYTA